MNVLRNEFEYMLFTLKEKKNAIVNAARGIQK